MTVNEVLSNLSWIDAAAGPVWIGLTFIMFFIMIRIYIDLGWENPYMKWMYVLIGAVYAYPLYTGFFQWLTIAEIGNIFTLLLTAGVAIILTRFSKKLSLLLIPQMVWTLVASIYMGLVLIKELPV